MVSEGEVKFRVRHDRPIVGWRDKAEKRLPVFAQQGGTTVVQIVDGEGTVLAEGGAICRPNENYNKRLGRMIALGRAKKALVQGSVRNEDVLLRAAEELGIDV